MKKKVIWNRTELPMLYSICIGEKETCLSNYYICQISLGQSIPNHGARKRNVPRLIDYDAFILTPRRQNRLFPQPPLPLAQVPDRAKDQLVANWFALYVLLHRPLQHVRD